MVELECETSCWSIPQAQCVGVDSAPSGWHQLRVCGRGKGCCACRSLFLVQAGRTSNRKSVSEKRNGAEAQSWRKSSFYSPQRFMRVQQDKLVLIFATIFQVCRQTVKHAFTGQWLENRIVSSSTFRTLNRLLSSYLIMSSTNRVCNACPELAESRAKTSKFQRSTSWEEERSRGEETSYFFNIWNVQFLKCSPLSWQRGTWL